MLKLPPLSEYQKIESASFLSDAEKALKNFSAEKSAGFAKQNLFSGVADDSLRKQLLNTLIEVSVAEHFMQALIQRLSGDFGQLFAKLPDAQVVRHEFGDLWGHALSLKQLIELVIAQQKEIKAAGKLRAESELLVRNASEALLLQSAFIQRRLKSKNLADLNNRVFLAVNSLTSAESSRALKEIIGEYTIDN